MNPNHANAIEGAKNLLFNAIKAQSSERLLIVGETGSNAHFDNQMCDLIAQTAKQANLQVEIVLSEVGKSASEFPSVVSESMQDVDHTLFCSRLGDQVRFCKTPGDGTKTMCYALDSDYLASDFCRTPYQISQQIHDHLLSEISQASQYHITCGLGTDLEGELLSAPDNVGQEDVFTEFEVKLFPLTIFPPVSCKSMSGQLVLKDWITSSSTIIYDDSVYRINTPVTATIKDGLITAFNGDADECAALGKHFIRVSQIVGGEAMAINSWHAGIIPSTWYKDRVEDDLEKWGSISYASPRLTHFHACGEDPGQIGINLLDATIEFDNQQIWKDGKFLLPQSADCLDLFNQYPYWKSSFGQNADIGI